ncbi:MAG: glycosyltransferase [Patescibacteria group bacterium]
MKILQVNKFNYRRGGAEKYFLDIVSALEDSGHEVALFSMRHPNNHPSSWEKYFVSNLDFRRTNIFNLLFVPGRIIYSLEARRKFARLLDDFKPDIIHLHNIYHQISPSILAPAKKRNIPVVMHLHDYKLFCPNYKLYTQNSFCERCRDGHYSQCLKYRCLDDSVFRSLIASVEMWVHHHLFKFYENGVDLFISPSTFVKNEAIKFSWPAEKIVVLTNFVDRLSDSPSVKEDYLLCYGRLSEEKGIDLLIEAMALVPENHLKIVGIGTSEEQLKTLTKKLKIQDRIEFLGFKSGAELQNLVSRAQAVVIPSRWPENMPFTMLEALGAGTPVIAANVGGLPEIIKEGRNGFLFQSEDAPDLAAKINLLPSLSKDAPKLAIESVCEFSLANHLKTLLKIYQEIINKKKPQ